MRVADYRDLFRFHDERGSVLLLGLGLLAVIVLALSVTTDAALAFTQRSTLQARADAAVLAGVQAIDLDAYYTHGATSATSLVPTSARSRVLEHLARAQASAPIEGIEVVSVTASNSSVQALLSAPVRTAFWPVEMTISVVSSAQLDYVG